MTQSSLLVYVGDEKKTLPIGKEGPVFAEWPDSPERALLEWELVESRKESGQEPLGVEETLEALRSEGYYCRPADGSYGILNHRVLTRGFLPGVRTPLPERPGEPVRFPVGHRAGRAGGLDRRHGWQNPALLHQHMATAEEGVNSLERF